MLKRILAAIFGNSSTKHGSLETSWIEGGLYITPSEHGGYRALKVLKVDEHGVHVRLYSNRFNEIPDRVDEPTLYMAGIDRKPDEELGMGHAPISTQSFSSWGAEFLQQSTVSVEELEGFEMWREAQGGYF